MTGEYGHNGVAALAVMPEDRSVTGIHLFETLRCRTAREAARVIEHLPAHLALTRAEAGCLVFEVTPTEDPLVWSVDERFMDAAAYRAHQQRVAASAWGGATAGIERSYEVEGL